MVDVASDYANKGHAMALTFKKLHPHFVGEVSAVDLRGVEDQATLSQIRAGMDEYAVLVFHDQSFTNEQQLAFAKRLDGGTRKAGVSAMVGVSRSGYDGVSDISNVNADGEIWASDDRKRMSRMTNRLWHTDQSFEDPAGRYSMLHAKTVPPVSADTEFADMRAAYDALAPDMKQRIAGLSVHHTTAYNKQILGFELTPAEKQQLKGADHPLVRTIPRSGRRALYLAAHASHIVGWPIPEGRMEILDLIEHSTQRAFVYRHAWRVGDFVIWDNRATMHRGRPYDDLKYRRELVRVTTLDVESAVS
jgi:alpha-ketoglutarate-dependent 2,4-dichlorophenoxyacetate dioxygenase